MSEGHDYGGAPSPDVMWVIISQNRDDIRDLKAENKDLKKRVGDLEAFKWWIMSIGAAVAALCTFFADQIKVMLGLKGA